METGKEEEGNESAIRRANPRTRRRRSKRWNSTNINSLPDDMLLQILARVPAEDLYQRARFVSSRWFRTIRGDALASAQLRHATPGILFVDQWNSSPAQFLSAARGGVEVSKPVLEIDSEIEPEILASCNGLILGEKNNGYYIFNPITKCEFNLPEFSGFKGAAVSIGIAYAAASNEYKVVATCRPKYNASAAEKFLILTVGRGADSRWCDVGMDQFSPRAKELLRGAPLVTESFMHWVSSSGVDILSFHVEHEFFRESRATLPPLECQDKECKYSYPLDYLDKKCRYFYCEATGRYITVLVPCGEWCWEVWEVIGETGECRKLLNTIDLGAQKSRVAYYIEFPLPHGWVRYPDLFAFLTDPASDSCIVYNLDTQEFDCVHLIYPSGRYDSVMHRNSLVCFS